ncbi:DUF2339 domain-containing protein [Lysinibacillus endophyticus]|uniref:DUF2339 domain-containing protein n=1 Tax=Ureibacillus endophyticus TaxID=1978490 RepID=UPI0020A177FA|nr:DUF2339 domain-containing protein [Lysinibacillus endophyticus]MCP1144975.1 DUF2339 domain-containing protein [Lysinibacillus endophyticus]
MDQETEKRIARLEEEVRALRFELNELRQNKQVIENGTSENHLVKLNKAAAQERGDKQESPKTILKPVVQEKPETPPKKSRSFEEMVVWALPKIFMLILVLGVLWGLKLISDYGLFSNTIKIILAYFLSIGLIVIATLIEKRKQDSSQVLTVVLYGGSFMIGSLTTAAGAILYEVIGLYVALFIAILYIAYGIIISYFKKNEVLSVFIIFTSLLLPYLLEYMEFNNVIILLYVLLLFGAMQWVFIKHRQRVALYVAYFFSIIALQIIYSLNEQGEVYYFISYVILNAVLLAVWLKTFEAGKFRALHEGMLFSLSGLTLLLIHFIPEYSFIAFIVLAIIYGSFAFYIHKRGEKRIVDVVGTLALLAFFNMLLALELSPELGNILLPLSTFIGIMLAVRLGAMLMKITYSLLFMILILGHILINDVEPFWSVEHLNYLLILIYLVVIFAYIKGKSIGKSAITFVDDFYPIIIVLYFFIYIVKFDGTYFSEYGFPYFSCLVLVIVMLGSFFLPERIVGRILRYVLIVTFGIVTLNLLPTHYVDGMEMWLNLIVRIVYACVIIGILSDVYEEGYLYNKWIRGLKINIDGLLMLGILGTMFVIYGVLNQLIYDGYIDYIAIVATKTILLFVTATISLWMSTKRKLKIVRVFGYTILGVAICKLIFIDLGNLSLLVRALLFIAVGGIGLLLSNQLLKSKK